nr:benzyl alcohol O-benzoyltransferase [Tanacetum cinerariifolium]
MAVWMEIMWKPILVLQPTHPKQNGAFPSRPGASSFNASLIFILNATEKGTREPELIAPASPTPRELKRLSNIDDQEGLRIHISAIFFYRPSANMQNKDPVSVIRETLAKVLVFYYPLAGRLKEGPARKLMVDCTGLLLAFGNWRCRTISLQPDPEEEMRLICVVSVHGKFNPPLLPVGYYGNSFALHVAISTARDLSTKPLSHALELVMKAKSGVTGDYAVSDITCLGADAVDCGWGKPAYGGPTEADVATYYIPYTNQKGESGIVLPICLPSAAMDKFVTELNKMLTHDNKLQQELSKL